MSSSLPKPPSSSPPSPPPLDSSDAERRLREAEDRLRDAIEELQRRQRSAAATGSQHHPPCDHAADESCVAHAIGNLCQSFLLSYGVRVGIGILLRAFKLARRQSYSSLLDLKVWTGIISKKIVFSNDDLKNWRNYTIEMINCSISDSEFEFLLQIWERNRILVKNRNWKLFFMPLGFYRAQNRSFQQNVVIQQLLNISRLLKWAMNWIFFDFIALQQLVSEKDLIVREEACRIGLFFGGFSGSYHALRCLLRKLRKKETPMNAWVFFCVCVHVCVCVYDLKCFEAVIHIYDFVSGMMEQNFSRFSCWFVYFSIEWLKPKAHTFSVLTGQARPGKWMHIVIVYL